MRQTTLNQKSSRCNRRFDMMTLVVGVPVVVVQRHTKRHMAEETHHAPVEVPLAVTARPYVDLLQ